MNFRNCKEGHLNTGGSACPINWGKVKGAILVEHGIDVIAELDFDVSDEWLAQCHAGGKSSIYPIGTFVEYAREGGEVQTNAVGYGGTKVTGVSPRNDTFTLDVPNEALNASLLETKSKKWDAYFYDEDNYLYGQRDEKGNFIGIPMQSVYSNLSEHPTSGEQASHTVTFCYQDAEKYLKNIAYVKCGFDIGGALIGLTPVELVKVTGSTYKIVEKFGGYDRSEEIAEFASSISGIFSGVTAATFTSGVDGCGFDLTFGSGSTPGLVPANALYGQGIVGVEYVGTI